MNLLGQYALQFIGKEYVFGGNGPRFDCSGFVLELLKAGGIFPPHDMTAQQIFEWLRPRSEWNVQKPGSLVFFGRATNLISHVGFCLDVERMIEAGGGDSKTKTAEDAQKQGAFVRVRPISFRRDFVCALYPPYPSPI